MPELLSSSTLATFTTTPRFPGEDPRALYAQSLYNAGIGFFPLRGNHDNSAAIASAFQTIFPQTQNGIQNQTLKNVSLSSLNLTTTDITNLGLPSTRRPAFTLGHNFSSPPVSTALSPA